MSDYEITRLEATHAPQIKACFEAVYGDSYANELFYTPMHWSVPSSMGLCAR